MGSAYRRYRRHRPTHGWWSSDSLPRGGKANPPLVHTQTRCLLPACLPCCVVFLKPNAIPLSRTVPGNGYTEKSTPDTRLGVGQALREISPRKQQKHLPIAIALDTSWVTWGGRGVIVGGGDRLASSRPHLFHNGTLFVSHVFCGEKRQQRERSALLLE